MAECLDKPLLELAQFFICEAHFPNRTQKVSLADLTAASHNPPKFGACGGINRHSTFRDRMMTDRFFVPFEEFANSIKFIPRVHEIDPIVWADLPTSAPMCEKSI